MFHAVLFSVLSASASHAPCDSPALVDVGLPYSRQYNELVCDGLAMLVRDQPRQAARKFEAALAMKLFEKPNYRLLPYLALANALTNEFDAARENIAKAELSLEVATGVARCIEIAGSEDLVYVSGAPMVSPYRSVVATTMCGAAYDGYYIHDSLEDYLERSRLVAAFLDIKNRVSQLIQSRNGHG
jgi:hypothetical protein